MRRAAFDAAAPIAPEPPIAPKILREEPNVGCPRTMCANRSDNPARVAGWGASHPSNSLEEEP